MDGPDDIYDMVSETGEEGIFEDIYDIPEGRCVCVCVCVCARLSPFGAKFLLCDIILFHTSATLAQQRRPFTP